MKRSPRIADEDLLLINRDGVTYTITGDVLKEQLSSIGGGNNALSPGLPPFAGYSSMAMNLTASDGKSEFSLDGETFASTLTVPTKTFYYVRYTDDILTAIHGTTYSMSISVEFPDLGVTDVENISFVVDKVPDPFSFSESTDDTGGTTYETQVFSPLESVNAPTSIWCSSTAINPQINIADEGWIDCPTVPDNTYVERGQTVQLRHEIGTDPLTTYATTLYIGFGLNPSNHEESTFSQTTKDMSFDPGTVTANTGTEVATTGTTFSISEATGTNITHTATDWQLASDATFETIVDESLDDETNVNSWTSTAELTVGDTYHVRARYIDASGYKSGWNQLDNLVCAELFLWKLAVRIKGGRGGRAGWAGNSQTLQDGREGGQGTVELVMVNPAAGPVGTVQSSNGTNASTTASGGGGFLGSNGGNGKNRNNDYWAGGGGGGGGFIINEVFVAGVGGSGGNGPRDVSQGVILGGQGASLPAADGGTGNWGETGGTAGEGGTVDEADVTDPTAAPTPGVGQAGRQNGSGTTDPQQSSGAGAGGWGGGMSGYTNTNSSGRTQGGGGGASWNREVGFIIDDQWKVESVTNAYTTTAQQLYKATLAEPDTWVSVGTAGHGTRSISSLNSSRRIVDKFKKKNEQA